MGLFRPLFVYFRPFQITIQSQIEKSVDVVVGIPTRGRRMVGADRTTEQWRLPQGLIRLDITYDGLAIKRLQRKMCLNRVWIKQRMF